MRRLVTPFAPVQVFSSFAETDVLLLEQLERYLSLLRRNKGALFLFGAFQTEIRSTCPAYRCMD